MANTNRFSCKCKLCKGKWTTEEKNRQLAFDAHGLNCSRYTEILAKRRAIYPSYTEAAERYQMSALYFQHLPITGTYNAQVKCDGRCMGATGHNCECSCGGANHGVAAAV